jgi:hypothetical protein
MFVEMGQGQSLYTGGTNMFTGGTFVPPLCILKNALPSKCSPLGLWTAARLCAKNNKFYDFVPVSGPLGTNFFLHNRTAGSPRKTMVSVIFCHLLTFSIWDCPKIYIGAYV